MDAPYLNSSEDEYLHTAAFLSGKNAMTKPCLEGTITMKRQLHNVIVCAVIAIATPIYLLGMCVLFCISSMVHGVIRLIRHVTGGGRRPPRDR
jgi:hypothetical protein